MADYWLGFDWGTGWIGVACGQTQTHTASEMTPLRAKNGIPNWQDIDELVEQWKPAGFVVGIPYNMDGSDSEMTVRANKFRKRLHGRYGLPANGIDERLSTKEAMQHLSSQPMTLSKARKAKVDSIAAQIILQSWLNEQLHHG
jgi:putative Holliday junction resolvase